MSISVEKPDELRIALTMRGGVSLAVWMGGACREVARLRAREGLYDELLNKCGYTQRPVVDVLSGSSAGGLNGVLFAWHLTRAASFDQRVRDLWLRLGDLDAMVRTPLARRLPSLLSGDRYFFRTLRTSMQELLVPPVTGSELPVGHPVRLLVTATRITARADAVLPTAGVPLRAGSSRAFFAFRSWGAQAPAMGDFVDPPGSSSGSGPGPKLTRLAYAGRTTSSFPGAFEPARSLVGRPDSASDAAAWRRSDGSPDMRGLCSETGAPDPGAPDGSVELIDGGLLDNIPLGWAIRGIAGMPAPRRVDRWLLYLHPAPETPDPAGPAPRHRSVTRLARLLLTALAVKGNTESVLDDAKQLRDLTAAAAQHDAVLLSPVPAGKGALAQMADKQWTVYRDTAGQAEAARMRTLLTDPLAVVGPDPLPIPAYPFPLEELVDGSGDEEAAPLQAPSVEQGRALVTGHVGRALPAPGDLGRTARTPLVAARAVTLLLSAVRQAEAEMAEADAAEAPESWVAELATLRRDLYDLRLACEVVTAVRDRLVLAAARADPTQPVAELVRRATVTLGELLGDLGSGEISDWASWAVSLADEATYALAAAAPTLSGAGDDALGWPTNPYGFLWAQLEQLEPLWQRVMGAPAPGGSQDNRWLSPIQVVQTADDLGSAVAHLEVVLGLLRPDPFASPSSVRLAVASAAERSPLETRIFDEVLPAAQRVRRKLSGNQTGNFAAFLSARWRLSDWIWGRLDVTHSLVRMIVRPERIGSMPLDEANELFLHGLQTDDPWRAFLKTEWASFLANAGTAGAPGAQPATLSSRQVADAVVLRLQWDILREETPLLRFLHERPGNSDRPPVPMPTPAELRPLLLEGDVDPAHLDALQGIGSEVVADLLSRSEMRRTLIRVGLVAWRCALPAGRLGAVVQVVATLTIGALLYLPLLLCLLAPWASIVSALSAAAAATAATGSWLTWLHLPLAAVICLAAGIWAWQQTARRAGGLSPADKGLKARLIRHAGLTAAAVVAVALSVAGLCLRDTDDLWLTHLAAGGAPGGWQALTSDRGQAIAALTGLAVWAPLFYAAKPAGLRGGSWAGLFSEVVNRTMVSALLIAALVGFVAAGVAAPNPTLWHAAFALWAALVANLAALYVWLSLPSTRTPVEEGDPGLEQATAG